MFSAFFMTASFCDLLVFLLSLRSFVVFDGVGVGVGNGLIKSRDKRVTENSATVR